MKTAVTTILAAALLVLAAPIGLRAQTPVDTALVLAVDASGSISPAEFKLQKEGIATAITNQRVLEVVLGGYLGKLAVAYVEWGAPDGAQTMVPWTIVEDVASAQAFADAVIAAPRSIQSYNAIGDAIVEGMRLLDDCPCDATRKVIDISGDNPDMRSRVPALVSRRAAADLGITINALAILQDDRLGPGGQPWLVETYEGTVIAGPGAFVIAADSRADFARALLQKMILEIAGTPPETAQQAERPTQ
ncbi:MAG: DUF1194 domain-containing protein [Kiloniellales bacterium]